ncbi:hypothetical protein TI05_01300 [Achromatium sp. WMS3]|nr:hypothetical protein TI05_01300 [Achromatium sp. WMS3]
MLVVMQEEVINIVSVATLPYQRVSVPQDIHAVLKVTIVHLAAPSTVQHKIPFTVTVKLVSAILQVQEYTLMPTCK